MSPDGGGAPEGDLANAIQDSFGSFESMKNEFNDSIRVEPGKKYIKITTAIGTSRSVHSFLAAKDFTTSKGVQFKKGDILKAASWQNPTLNAPRGNIFGDYVVKWTGACYMDGQKRIIV